MNKLTFVLFILFSFMAQSRGLQNSLQAAPKDNFNTAYLLAEQGDAKFQYNLALMYTKGQAVHLDYKQAIHWYQKAMLQGYIPAQVNLGVMYEHGLGVNQDYKQAVYFYRKAAKQGHPVAQLNLGIMYENGLGLSQDYRQAANWYRQAAEQRLARAQINLGILYANGQGVTQDNEQAYMWFNLAKYNSFNTEGLFELLTPSMTGQNISKAKEMSQACIKLNYKSCGQ